MDSDLDRARNGDREAMAKIVDSHYDAVFRFCARRIGPDAAQDAAQETFLTAQKRIKSFAGNSSMGTWLFGIAHNHCRNIARKRKMEGHGYQVFGDRCSGSESDPDNLSTREPENLKTLNPARQIIDRQALRQALGELSPDHREVVLLHEVEGLTYQEAAEVLGVPEGTVKSRLHHAFLNLRRALIGTEEVTA